MNAPSLLSHQRANIRRGIAVMVAESLATGEYLSADRIAAVVFEEIDDLEDAFGIDTLEDWAETHGYVKPEPVK